MPPTQRRIDSPQLALALAAHHHTPDPAGPPTVDLFAGAGGLSLGAHAAGARLVGAVNHWRQAVDTHSRAFPEVQHSCEDAAILNPLHLPAHTFLACAPSCVGHTKARGVDKPHHDTARATAWCVLRVAEPHRPRVIVVENVPELRRWALYPAWRMALHALGYVLTENILDAADCGVPQHRVRLFVVATHRSVLGVRAGHEATSQGIAVPAPAMPHQPCGRYIDTDLDAGPNAHSRAWRPWRDLCANTRDAVRAARWRHGDGAFLLPYYKASRDRGWSLDRPIGTLTTHDRYAVVVGDYLRMLSVPELTALSGFPADYPLTGTRAEKVMQLGNAVCPPAGEWVVRHALRAAGLLPTSSTSASGAVGGVA